MSTYSENNGRSEETQGSVSAIQKILTEMGKSPNTYKKYAQKTVEEVVEEIRKGEIYWDMDFDDPLPGAYYTVVQNHTMGEEAKAIARIIQDFDESDLAKSGIKIEGNQQLLVYRLYELNCNKQLDIKNISLNDFNTLTKYADWFGKSSNGGWKNAVCLEGGSYGYENIQQKPTHKNDIFQEQEIL